MVQRFCTINPLRMLTSLGKVTDMTTKTYAELFAIVDGASHAPWVRAAAKAELVRRDRLAQDLADTQDF